MRRAHRPMLDVLAALARRGVRITYHEGNHDFRLGEGFRTELRARVLEGGAEIRFGRVRFWFEHGDEVNRKDYAYRLLRKTLRSAPLGMLRKAVPESWILKLARWMSHESREKWGKKGYDYAVVFREYARRRIAEGYDAVVLGHSHLPEITALEGGDSRRGVFVNTGDWMDQFTYLEIDHRGGGGMRLALKTARPGGRTGTMGTFTFAEEKRRGTRKSRPGTSPGPTESRRGASPRAES